MKLDDLITAVEESLNGYSDMNFDNITSLKEVLSNMSWTLQMTDEYLHNLKIERDTLTLDK